MPAKSRAQQKYIYANFGAEFAKRHHFNTKGPLPARAKKTAKKRRKR